MSANQLNAYLEGGCQLRGDRVVEISPDGVHFAGSEGFSLKNLGRGDLEFISALQRGMDGEGLRALLETPRNRKLLEILNGRKVLKFAAPKTQMGTLHRQVDWLSYFKPGAVDTQKRIETRRVAIVGCGGTGSIVAMHLARAGVRHFVLIDPAMIDPPDLNRQLPYFAKDVGRRKVHVLREHLLEINGEVDAKVWVEAVTSTEWLEVLLKDWKTDLIVNCADKPMGHIQAWVAEASLRLDVPALFGGVGLEEASVGPLLVDRFSKQAFIDAMKRAASSFKESNPLGASICFTNSLTSILLAFEAFKYLSGISTPVTEGKSMALGFENYQWNLEFDWKKGSSTCSASPSL